MSSAAMPERAYRLVRVALAAALLCLLLPLPAAAHADLQSSDPTNGATVPSPFSGPVVMTFTESLAVGSKADLYGPGRQVVASATIDAGTMTIALASPLPAGDYTVEWVSVADDGDLLRGTLRFSVSGAAGPSVQVPTSSPSTTATNRPTAASSGQPTASEGLVSPSPSPATPGTTGGAGGDVIVPIVVALIVAAAGAFYLVRRNRPA
jgi:methionine-rich copper-binding protein CopC